MTTTSRTLRPLATAANRLIGSPLDVLSESPDRRLFYMYMATSCHIIRASIDIMECMIGQFPNIDRYHQVLNYLRIHIAEENNHYEWLVEDLKEASNQYVEYLNLTAIGPVFSIPGTAYYYIRNINPMSGFGYISALESNPPDKIRLKELAELCSVPESALRTLLLHSDADVDHIEDLYDIIESNNVNDDEFFHIRNLFCITKLQCAAGYKLAVFGSGAEAT
jgi:hypothetical protein